MFKDLFDAISKSTEKQQLRRDIDEKEEQIRKLPNECGSCKL